MANDAAKLQRTPREIAKWQTAQQHLLGERPAAALAGYNGLVQRFPGVAQLWFELGMAAIGDLDFPLAEKAFQRAENLGPSDASLLVLLGQQYHRLRQLEKARACFERAVRADPRSLHAQLSLAAWCEREHRLEDAWQCVEAAVAQQPQNPQALCVRALLLHRKNRNAEAQALLRDIIDRDTGDFHIRYSSRQLLGVILDAEGNYHEAMQWLVDAKKFARQTANTTRMEQDYDRSVQCRRKLLDELTPETVRNWRKESFPTAPQLAFLGGHPRSGTTLLEQILGAHPGILAFDEPDAFTQEIWNRLAPMQAGKDLSLAELDHMDSKQRDIMRQRYLKSLFREVKSDVDVQVLLDKNPSPTASLHLWLRIFPELKVIIALRDPRDVVLSCFFQDLMLTPTNSNFLSLERTATHYSDLMDVWLRLREIGGFDWLEIRYEDIVANLEKEGRRVTEFLGLSWHPLQARHHENALQKMLYAPTYNDVTQPVHNRSIGRWKHYEEALAPLGEQLKPYIEAFGYTAV